MWDTNKANNHMPDVFSFKITFNELAISATDVTREPRECCSWSTFAPSEVQAGVRVSLMSLIRTSVQKNSRRSNFVRTTLVH